MLHEVVSTNITIKVIENICNKLNVELNEVHKSIIAILVPSLIYRQGSIVILSEVVRRVNKILKKHNEKYDLVNLLLAIDCIDSIDKYGTISIPIAYLLNKLTINRTTISNKGEDILKKKVLTCATSTLCITELLNHIGVPKIISIPIVNILLELFYTDIDKEATAMKSANVAFKNKKMSDLSETLKAMQFEKIFISTGLLMIIASAGLKISASLILVNVLTELIEVVKVEHKKRHLKSFLN
jgi:hypothetical protein